MKRDAESVSSFGQAGRVEGGRRRVGGGKETKGSDASRKQKTTTTTRQGKRQEKGFKKSAVSYDETRIERQGQRDEASQPYSGRSLAEETGPRDRTGQDRIGRAGTIDTPVEAPISRPSTTPHLGWLADREAKSKAPAARASERRPQSD